MDIETAERVKAHCDAAGEATKQAVEDLRAAITLSARGSHLHVALLSAAGIVMWTMICLQQVLARGDENYRQILFEVAKKFEAEIRQLSGEGDS